MGRHIQRLIGSGVPWGIRAFPADQSDPPGLAGVNPSFAAKQIIFSNESAYFPRIPKISSSFGLCRTGLDVHHRCDLWAFPFFSK